MTTAEDTKTPNTNALPKATIRKPTRLDFSERDVKVSKLLDKVTEFQQRAKEITKTLDDIHSAGRGNNKQEKFRRELADMRHLKQQLQRRRDNARTKLQEISNVGGNKSAVKKSMHVASAEDISEAMASLQNTLTSTADPEQRRRIIEQIQKLHASYEQITDGKAVLGSEYNEKLRAQLTAEMATCSAELEALQPAEEDVRSRLEQLQAEQQASEPDIQALKTEREQCMEIVNQLRDKVTEIRNDWQEKFANYREQMELWKAEQNELRANQDAIDNAEREQRDTERKARALEMQGAPFTEEILRCDQLAVWCQRYQTSGTQDEPKARVDVNALVMDGFVAKPKSKKDADEEPLSLSRAKSKKKSGRKSSITPSTEKGTPMNKVHLDMDTLAVLSKMRLPVPSSVADVNALAAKVAAKKAEFQDKQKRALAGEVIEKEQPEVEEKPSTSKPAKGTVIVDMRSDEVFGTVLVELAVA